MMVIRVSTSRLLCLDLSFFLECFLPLTDFKHISPDNHTITTTGTGEEEYITGWREK
jgi:hypothetical protein